MSSTSSCRCGFSRSRLIGALSSAAVCALLSLCPPALACEPPAGRLLSAQGVVERRAAGNDGWTRIAPPQPLCEGDQITVRAPGRAAIALGDDVLVRLDENTTLQLARVAPEADVALGLGRGIAHVLTRLRQRFEVVTPFVNALVEGTEFTVGSTAAGAQVVVAEGALRVHNALGVRHLSSGEAAQAEAGTAPRAIDVRPLDAVRWAIHYPQVVWLDAAARAALEPAAGEAVAAAQQAMAAGRASEALALLEALPAAAPVAAVEALRISLLLALGRVDRAQALLDARAPTGDVTTGALAAVIHVARNDPGSALVAARQAVAQPGASAAAHLALSHALQAGRALPQALAAAREAVRIAPEHPFAWARQAELELSLAQVAAGRASAQQALARAPTLPRARALLGFATLLEGDTRVALAHFGAAVADDSTDPLPRLGSGLAHVRNGELARGRRDIELAVMLDPGNAELRSYLGRIYVEEDRSALGGAQFALARRLDPASPTPWYFDAFRKLRDNDPLGAIADAGEAIARNDNRAVLRSSQLLDSDRAARSATLAAAYGEVGFEQPMLAAAMRTLDDDALAAAGHRLLAHAYADTPRFESARLSALLQAQVRQPIGQAPIPPQFLSRDLPIVAGPRALAPDEAAALFEHRPSHLAATLLGGSHHTVGDSLVGAHSGARAQVSFGHFDYRHDGLGDRDDTDLSGSRLGAQFAASAETMLYAELGHDERRGGDVVPRLLEGAALAWDQRVSHEVRTDRGRLTVRHTPDVNREYLLSAGWQHAREATLDRLTRSLFGFDVEAELDVRTRLQARELGLLHGARGPQHSLAMGLGSYRESRRQTLEDRFNVVGFPSPAPAPERTREALEHHNAFAYLDLRPAPWATVHLGGAYAALSGSPAVAHQGFSAKFGASFQPAPGTTLRLATLQGLKGPKYQDQTLEPTQFAGFNQLFDDLDGTRWRRTAAGLDHRFASGLMAGLEWSARTLSVPGLGCSDTDCRARWRERLHRAYVALPLGQRAALSAAWRYERVHLEGDAAALVSLPHDTRSDALPLALWLRLDQRWSTAFEALRVRQHSAVTDSLQGGSVQRSERFWLANARLSYAGPGRRSALSVSVHNLFDRRFALQDTDLNGNPRVPLYFPRRTALLQLQLRF
ncbi:MAG TPA: FecR domain-containing protein [Thauera sp.]|nr:FecR domain-containing protein [Thauera sp.]